MAMLLFALVVLAGGTVAIWKFAPQVFTGRKKPDRQDICASVRNRTDKVSLSQTPQPKFAKIVAAKREPAIVRQMLRHRPLVNDL